MEQIISLLAGKTDYLVILAVFITTIATYSLTPFWIKRAASLNITGKDIHKTSQKEIPEMGGVTVVMGFMAGLTIYISVLSFLNYNLERIVLIFAAATSVLTGTIVGMLDDILGWKVGLKQWQKPLLMFFAALPLMAISFSHRFLYIPFIDNIQIGITYSLIIIPMIIVGTSNGFNMIGGYNGLETGMGIILLSSLSILSFMTNAKYVGIMSLIMVFALIVFLIYNKYPAKVFPGDSMTYSVGVLFGIIALLAHLEVAAGIMFSLYFIELILKARGKFKKESFSRVKEDNSLEPMYSKIYAVEHVALRILKKFKKKVYEQDVVRLLWLTQTVICIAVIILYQVVI
ncbi:MAG: MraY family glycosyltransferase [Candidatus Woesearchaeota archaeon]